MMAAIAGALIGLLLTVPGCARHPGVTAPAAPVASEDTVALRFDWPSLLELRVERSFERIDTRPDGGASPSIASVVRYTWRGERSGSKYKITFSDFEVVREAAPPTSTDPFVQLEYAARTAEALLPTIIVDATGQPVAFEGMGELRAQLAQRYRAIPGIDRDPHAQRVMMALLSEPTLAQRALEDWNRMVQVWHGARAVVGRPWVSEGDRGGVAPAVVHNRWSYVLAQRIPCDGDVCVQAVIRQTPRFTDARAAARALLGFDFVSALAAPPTATLEVENTYATATHAASLVPMQFAKEKRWSVSWEGAAGDVRTVARADRWSYRFDVVR